MLPPASRFDRRRREAKILSCEKDYLSLFPIVSQQCSKRNFAQKYFSIANWFPHCEKHSVRYCCGAIKIIVPQQPPRR